MNAKWILALALLVAAYGWRTQGSSADLPDDRLEGHTLVETIVHDGSDVELDAHVDTQAWTLFEYAADW